MYPNSISVMELLSIQMSVEKYESNSQKGKALAIFLVLGSNVFIARHTNEAIASHVY